MAAPAFALGDIALFERPVDFVTPFRFGAVTVERAHQAFVRVEIVLADGRRGIGGTAELMVPKWFDKRPHLSPEATVDELRQALMLARGLYVTSGRQDTAFGHHGACYPAHMAAAAAAGVPALAAAFGPAQIDKAILDALLRALGMDVFTGFSGNVMGLDARLTPDLDAGQITAFLSARRPLPQVALRHTVGMADPLTGPGGLEAIVEETGARYFKLKLSGDVAADVARLGAIWLVLESVEGARASLDANEQYADLASLRVLLARLSTDAALRPLFHRLLYLEQPLPRDLTLEMPLDGLGADLPLIIDEADDTYGAFPAARALGYGGVSSKSCKGLYKSLLNGARARTFGGFLTGEDLTCQAGLAVQQDTALAAFLGLQHVERNGHHYAPGFGIAPVAEAERFAAAHPDFYEASAAGPRLAIRDGVLETGGLGVPGFASAVLPDWDSLSPLAMAVAEAPLREGALS